MTRIQRISLHVGDQGVDHGAGDYHVCLSSRIDYCIDQPVGDQRTYSSPMFDTLVDHSDGDQCIG